MAIISAPSNTTATAQNLNANIPFSPNSKTPGANNGSINRAMDAAVETKKTTNNSPTTQTPVVNAPVETQNVINTQTTQKFGNNLITGAV